MTTTQTRVNGHTLTEAGRRAAHQTQDWLRSFGGGRWVPLTQVFPRDARGNAGRQAVRRLHRLGVLAAFEVAYYGDCVKAVPAERVAEVERAIAAMTPQERESAARGG